MRAIRDVAEAPGVLQHTLRNRSEHEQADRGERDDTLTSAEREDVRDVRQRVRRRGASAERRAMSEDAATTTFPSPRQDRAVMLWGLAVGVIQAATPLLIWWLDRSTVYALRLVVIAGIYVGFAVADGRPKVIRSRAA